ncbi:MAG: tetratricopeptide repeat protein [Candidatus Thermoplasmatota archaeon]|nr:tetratricopeptide repeat protein [Candidatus Thermoplasmatota archaeon]
MSAKVGAGQTQKSLAEEFFTKGNAAYDAGDYTRALEMFDKAIESGMESEIVQNNRGASLDALGRSSEAVASYTKATSMDSSYELAWHNLGNSLYTQEAYGLAARAYARASSLKPDRRENWSGLAASYARLGRARKAKSAIKHLDAFVSEDDIVLLTQAELYMESGLLEEAHEKCEQYVTRHPESALGYAHRGNVEHEMGAFAKAIDTFEKALSIAPEDKEVRNNLGYAYFIAGYLDKAIESFDRALSIDPRYKHAWYNKGYAYHGADMLEQAVDSYRRALEIDPHDKVLWNNLGNALYNLGKYTESIPKFVEAINVDPDYEIAWNNIGNAFEKMHLHREAIPYHDRSLEIRPDFDYALYAKGVCKAVTGDLEQGYDLVLESMDLNPTYDEAWRARAEIAIQLGRWDEALKAIEEAISINPDYDQGWVTRAEILLAVGDYEPAQASFEMALKCLDSIRPETSGRFFAIIRRGELLKRIGRFEEALASFESVVVSGRLGSASIPKVLELRRLLDRWELPSAVREAAESIGDPKVKIEYARFLVDAGEPSSAERVFSSISEPVDDNGAYLAVKARLGSARGEPTGVLLELAESPKGQEASRALLAEAEALESRREFGEASRAYSLALEADSLNMSAAVGLARIRLASGNAKSALAMADRAIGMDRHDWEPHGIKAAAYRSFGKKPLAKAELAEVKALARSAGVRIDELVPGEGK